MLNAVRGLIAGLLRKTDPRLARLDDARQMVLRMANGDAGPDLAGIVAEERRIWASVLQTFEIDLSRGLASNLPQIDELITVCQQAGRRFDYLGLVVATLSCSGDLGPSERRALYDHLGKRGVDCLPLRPRAGDGSGRRQGRMGPWGFRPEGMVPSSGA